MLFGDLNARTSCEVDFILNDSPRYLPLFDSYKPDDKIKLRKSHDNVLDERGKELIDLCITYQMPIVNGRCIGDLLGNFTCFNTQGQSTVDYLITNERLLNQLLYLKVSDFLPLHSDCHYKISWEILAKFNFNNSKNTCTDLRSAPSKFIWTNESHLKFQEALLSTEIQHKIDSFIENDCGNSEIDINQKAEDLNDFFLSAAKFSLKRSTCKKNKRGSKTRKKWFDSDLFKMRQNLISYGKIFSKYPKDPIIRGSYYKKYKLYNKCRKIKYKQFMNSMLDKLDNRKSIIRNNIGN
jgi:hypothetical protein